MTDQDPKDRKTSNGTTAAGPPAPVSDAVPPKPTSEPEPHPSSSHRTPGEIARDESGTGGPSVEPQAQNSSLPGKVKTASKEDQNIRAAVQRSAHADRKKQSRRATGDAASRARKR